MAIHSKRSKKTKSVNQIDPSYRKGMVLLEEKLFKQATVEIKIALERNPDVILPELETLFEKLTEQQEIEKALAIGLVIFYARKSEALAIQLGKYARQTGDYKQANNLYKSALKLNPSSVLAFYNLAASMGRVDWYDEEIPRMIKEFYSVTGLITPEFLPHNDTIQRIQGNLKQEYLKNKQEKLEKLEESIQLKMDEGDEEAAAKLLTTLNQLIDESEKVDYPTTREALQGYIDRKLEEDLSEREEKQLYEDIYNFGLYVLKNKDIELALEYFLILKSKALSIEDLEICIATAYAMMGKRKDAVAILTEKIKHDPDNRILNINLAQIHKAEGNKLLSYKYQIKSAWLLEKSSGLVLRSEILNKADFYFKQEKLDRALTFYKIIAYEKKDLHAWLMIGEIHLMRKRQLEAMDAFREIKHLYPDHPAVKKKLREVHDTICQQAEALFNEAKFKQASIIYERALKLLRSTDTIKKLISVYKQLHHHEKVQTLYEELNHESIKEVADKKAERLQTLIENGKKALRNNDYESAIFNFENAYNIRPTKDVFVYLAQIYKGLNRKSVLRELVEHWNAHGEGAIEQQETEQ